MITQRNITALRMKRQYLSAPANEKAYDSLFNLMSPVPTMYWCTPGDPPTLPSHVNFNDYEYNTKRRAFRKILKGRFAGGSIAYVLKKDLEIFACLYKKDIKRYTENQSELMELLEHEGPMNIGLMKEYTGLLVKDITPALHKLQEAFIVYEDQVDNEGDRSWYLFESEFPEIELSKYNRQEALALLIPRFAQLCVFFDGDMLKSYYKVQEKLIKEALEVLVKRNVLITITIDKISGYMLTKDYELLQSDCEETCVPSVLLLQRNDFLVRAFADILKQRYTSDWDTLYYILIDGEFHGAVTGRFKFGPHVVEDVILDLPGEKLNNHSDEIVKAIQGIFNPVDSPIKRWNGEDL